MTIQAIQSHSRSCILRLVERRLNICKILVYYVTLASFPEAPKTKRRKPWKSMFSKFDYHTVVWLNIFKDSGNPANICINLILPETRVIRLAIAQLLIPRPLTATHCSYVGFRWHREKPESFQVQRCRLYIMASADRRRTVAVLYRLMCDRCHQMSG